MKQCIAIIFTIMFYLSIATGMSYAEETTVLEFEGSASNTAETSLDINHEKLEYIRVIVSEMTDATEANLKFLSEAGSEIHNWGTVLNTTLPFYAEIFDPDKFPIKIEASISPASNGTIGAKIIIVAIYQ